MQKTSCASSQLECFIMYPWCQNTYHLWQTFVKHWMPFPSSSLNPREFSCWTSRPRAPPKPSSVPSFRSKSLSASSGEARSDARTYNRTCFHDAFMSRWFAAACLALLSLVWRLGGGTIIRIIESWCNGFVQEQLQRQSGSEPDTAAYVADSPCLKRQHFLISEILIKWSQWSCEKYPEKINAHFDWLASVWGKMEDTGILAVSCVCFWGRWTSQWTCILTTSW